jgi:hypothetical protein
VLKTKCPQRVEDRTNVTVHEAPMYREIAGIDHDCVLVLRTGVHRTAKREAIISPYRQYALKDKFWFKCADRQHYVGAGKEPDSD